MGAQLNDIELIKLVETFPILYAKDQGRGHKNALIKDEAWRKVSEVLQKSERACITRWKSIRDRFGKELRRVQEHPDEPTNWDLFAHLLFLQDHYKQGFAKIDFIENVKYEPKARKRKVRDSMDNSNENDLQNSDRWKDDQSDEDALLNRELINLVREHDVLYDRIKVRDSKNLIAKNDAWQMISNSVGITEEECYMKWKKLRDRFSREYRRYCLNPQRVPSWRYFQDLMFLASHYRKGKALPLGHNRSETIEMKTTTPWSTEITKVIPFDYDENGFITEEHESTLHSDDTQDQYLDDPFIVPVKKTSPSPEVNSPIEMSCMSTLTSAASTSSKTPPLNHTTLAITDAEEKLSNVITNMEVVLKQSQDCLKSLQQQKNLNISETANATHDLALQGGFIQKINVLLDGMQVEQRNQAEKKILQFLCECQSKVLNNEEIEDVSSINPF